MIYLLTTLLLLAVLALLGIVQTNHNQTNNIMAKISTLAETLGKIENTLNKVKTEVETLINNLGDADIPEEAQASLNRLSALADSLDQLNQDTPPTEPTEPA